MLFIVIVSIRSYKCFVIVECVKGLDIFVVFIIEVVYSGENVWF